MIDAISHDPPPHVGALRRVRILLTALRHYLQNNYPVFRSYNTCGCFRPHPQSFKDAYTAATIEWTFIGGPWV